MLVIITMVRTNHSEAVYLLFNETVKTAIMGQCKAINCTCTYLCYSCVKMACFSIQMQFRRIQTKSFLYHVPFQHVLTPEKKMSLVVLPLSQCYMMIYNMETMSQLRGNATLKTIINLISQHRNFKKFSKILHVLLLTKMHTRYACNALNTVCKATLPDMENIL